MEEVKSNEVKSIDLEALRVSLQSSSTSHRKAELHALEERLQAAGRCRSLQEGLVGNRTGS